MGRASTATVARPPAKRRKPSHARKGSVPDTHRRPARRGAGPAKRRTSAHKRPVAAAGARRASVAVPPRPKAAPFVRGLIHGRAGALLDGLLRGRACVGIVFILLVGVVFSNVSLLEMNKGIAATNAQATAIEQENAKLRRQIAPLASSERIQTEAVKHGYSLPAAGDVFYIRGTAKANAKKAAARMVAPGMGEGTASRPAAQVQQEQQAANAAQTQAAAPPAPAPEPTTPATGTTPTMAPTAVPPAATPPTASANSAPTPASP